MTFNRSGVNPTQFERIMLTGCTGFVGSALAARLLAQGCEVIALSRNDLSGRRTLSSIEHAIEGLGLELDSNWTKRVQVVDLKPSSDQFEGVSALFHCGAEMSYRSSVIEQSMAFNVGYSSWLLGELQKNCPDARFTYVSTAFVAPFQSESPVAEALHSTCDAMNSYQLSKWSTEHALRSLSKRLGSKLTVFRPSIIVGSLKTGWGGGKANGYYQFVDVFRLASRLNCESVRFPLHPKGVPNLISIDSVISALHALFEKRETLESFEVVQCTGASQVANQKLLEIMSGLTQVKYFNELGVSPWERKISGILDLNRPFADHSWSFSSARLDALIGRSTYFSSVTEQDIHRMTEVYLSMEPRHPLAVPSGGMRDAGGAVHELRA